MDCPFCQAEDTKVIDTRLSLDGDQIKRRRECIQCHQRYNTLEIAELSLPRVIKRDERPVPFQESKLRASVLKALDKRKVSTEKIEKAIAGILKKVHNYGEKEISSQQIGLYAMSALLDLDDVAYVRYASVYHRFETLDAFLSEIQQLKKTRGE